MEMKFRNLKVGLCIKFHARQALCAHVRAGKNRSRENRSRLSLSAPCQKIKQNDRR